MAKIFAGIFFIMALLIAGACTPGPGSTPVPAAPPVGEVTPSGRPAGVPSPDKWTDLTARARKEGRVMIYAGAIHPEVRRGITQTLDSKFGLQVEFVSGRGAETVARYLREREAGIFAPDVLIVGHTSHVGILKARGILRPIEPLIVLPEITDPNAWPEKKIAFLDKDGMIIPLAPSFSPFVAVNTEVVKKEEIRSYRDLLKPEWKAKMVMFDPTITGNGLNWVAFMMSKVYDLEEGKAYLKSLARQELFITRDTRLQLEWVARAKYPVALAPTVAALAEFRRAGAPIDMALPVEGGQIIPGADTLGAPREAPHPEAQALVVNWLLSKEGQALYSKASGRPAARVDIPPEGVDPFFTAPPGYKVFPTDEEYTKFSSGEVVRTVSREIFGPQVK